jgi:hypothetical protein
LNLCPDCQTPNGVARAWENRRTQKTEKWRRQDERADARMERSGRRIPSHFDKGPYCGATSDPRTDCIKPMGHVDAGDERHSNGRRTWKDKPPKTSTISSAGELVWRRADTHQGRNGHALLVPPPDRRGIVTGALARRDALCGILLPRESRPPRKGEQRCIHCLGLAVKKHRKLLRLSDGRPLPKCPKTWSWRLSTARAPKAHAPKGFSAALASTALCGAGMGYPITGAKKGERGGPPRKTDPRCADCELITMQRENP